MPIIAKKWGNSAGIRIPAPVPGAAKITLEQPVEVRAEGGRIMIEPMRATSDRRPGGSRFDQMRDKADGLRSNSCRASLGPLRAYCRRFFGSVARQHRR